MPEHRMVRCLGHIIALTIKAFLFGRNAEAYESLEEEADDIVDTDEIVKHYDEWRKAGPIGKLRNVVNYVRASPQRRSQFAKISNKIYGKSEDKTEKVKIGLTLIQSNMTRWNSQYESIKRAIMLRDAVDRYSQKYNLEDKLSNDDWNVLADIISILKPFKSHTKNLEGRSATINDVIPTVELLLQKLESAKVTYANNVLATHINLAWMKLDEYYKKLDCAVVYAGSIVLDPRHKWTLFEEEWCDEWVAFSKEALERLWNQYRLCHINKLQQ